MVINAAVINEAINQTAINQTVAKPIMPVPDKVSAFFWEGARQERLLILRCDDCGYYVHWPRPICKRCRSFNLTPAEVSGRGSVYSYAIGMKAFHPWFEQRLPYILAVVELEEQQHLKLVTNLVDCVEDDVSVGMKVKVVFERVNDQLVLPMFRPAATAEHGAEGGTR
jgi:uncharacterized OB-fold protein